ncbi:hypothetical protein [Chryseobacterium gambrini]|uniref:hypothetical protein n=1 Tax=Chryseobacterium gambrini TaxID=373672 RepID=UPI0022F3C85E|nr:hypothetical protein [Chryseobacterium gambrini]WBX96617.1 hypothetical protein PE065_17460 [Chryseobacterium gambrini]
MKKIIISLLVLSAVACKKNPEKFVNDEVNAKGKTITDSSVISKAKITKDQSLKKINEDIIQALKDKNFKKFAEFIHPEKGVRFSMYAFVNPKEDKKFSKADFIRYQSTKTLFTWGTMDGSGDLYRATIRDYLADWVYSKDFATAQVSLNEFLGKGNSLNNLKEIYPNADFTENFMKGSEANSGMDWKCLRLIFEEFQGKYYLIGVVNDQWTI